MSDLIVYKQDGAIVTLALNRPELRNPISDIDMVNALVAALERLNADIGVRVAILTRPGRRSHRAGT